MLKYISSYEFINAIQFSMSLQTRLHYYDGLHYYDNVNDIYIYDSGFRKIYFKKGNLVHNENGPACHYNLFNCKGYYLNNIYYSRDIFSGKTNHKLCLICRDFCKQECFL